MRNPFYKRENKMAEKVKTFNIRSIAADPFHLNGVNGRVSLFPKTTTQHVPEVDWNKAKNTRTGKYLLDKGDIMVVKENLIDAKKLKSMTDDVPEDGKTGEKPKTSVTGGNDKVKITIGGVDADEVLNADTEDESSFSSPDWDYVDTLDDKVQIQEYAQGFGHKLHKTMSRDNMIAKFKELAGKED